MKYQLILQYYMLVIKGLGSFRSQAEHVEYSQNTFLTKVFFFFSKPIKTSCTCQQMYISNDDIFSCKFRNFTGMESR